MTERYVLASYELPSGSDDFHVAEMIQKGKPKAEIELIESGFLIFWTALSLEEVQQLVWPHNNGLLCECKEISEEQYDALC